MSWTESHEKIWSLSSSSTISEKKNTIKLMKNKQSIKVWSDDHGIEMFKTD